MRHELYIDGKLMDVDENTSITVSLKSNFLRDLADLTGNTTYTVQLPLTARNRAAINAVDILASGDQYPYIRHTCKYIRDGVPVIEDGMAVLVGITNKIEIVLTWGVNSNLTRLFGADMKLPSIPMTDTTLYTQSPSIPMYAYWLNKTSPSWAIFYAHADYNDPLEDEEQYRNAVTNHWVWTYKRPNIRVSYLLGRLSYYYGITFSFPTSVNSFLERLAIPLINDKAGAQGSDNITLDSWTQTASGMLFSETNDAAGSVFYQELSPTDTLYVSVGKTVTIHYEIDIDASTAPPFDFIAAGAYMYAQVIRVPDMTQIKGYVASFKVEQDTTGRIKLICHEDVDVELPDTQYGLRLYVQANEQFVAAYIADKLTTNAATIKISPDANHVQFGQDYPIAINLPDITVVEFLRTLCAILGVWVKQMNGDTLTFLPYSALWDNKTDAVDWTRRIIPAYNEDRPQGMEYTVQGWARHNLYQWKEADGYDDTFNGEIPVPNETLDEEKKAFESVFCVPRDNGKGVMRIPLYKLRNYDELVQTPTNPPSYEIKYPNPLICTVSPYRTDPNTPDDSCPIMLDNDGLKLQDIISERYGDLVGTLRQAKVITEKIKLSDIEVRDFDESVPIYLQQYGKYFGLLEADVQPNGVATCKLIELN